jgi:hypothetical protein
VSDGSRSAGLYNRTVRSSARRARLCRVTATALCCAVLGACGGKSASPVPGPSPAPPAGEFQVSFTTSAPDQCADACLRLAWTDHASVADGLLKIAVQVQHVPASGIASVASVLVASPSDAFGESTKSFVFTAWNAGDFFERLGKNVQYSASDPEAADGSCCQTAYSAAIEAPTDTDRVSGDGTLIVLVYAIREAGTVDLDPGLGILGDLLATTYPAQVTIVHS